MSCPYIHTLLEHPSKELHVKHQKWHNRRGVVDFFIRSIVSLFTLEQINYDFVQRRKITGREAVIRWLRRLECAVVTLFVAILPFIYIEEGECFYFSRIRFSRYAL